MARFKSLAGTQTSFGIRFDKNGFFETEDKELIEKLRKLPYTQELVEKKQSDPEPFTKKKG